ncbi:MAG: phytoene/squalene synthase family protein [Pseudomonadota bacterium]
MSTAHLLQQLKEADYVRYCAVLFAPEDKRQALTALSLFQAEIERIRDLVSEPLPGEIRLQWWRDVFLGMRDSEAKANPLAAALLEARKTHVLPHVHFTDYLDAMEFDLYDDPMPSIGQFEGHMGETQSVFFQMAMQILSGTTPEDGDAAGHAGVAYGVTQTLLNLRKQTARRQTYVPAELLAKRGVDDATWRSGAAVTEIDAVIRDFVAFGETHLDAAQNSAQTLKKAARTALLPMSICKPIFARVKADPTKFLKRFDGVGRLQVQWSMFKAAWRA